MDCVKIMGHLEKLGYKLRLAIDYESTGAPSSEAREFLRMLSDNRDEAIDYLIAGRIVPLPDDIAIPAEWNMSGKMKRYVLDAPEQVIETIGERHSPVFALLWAVKALCFIKGGKSLYERVEAVIREAYGFDYAQYEADWRRYAELLDTKPDEIQAKSAEFAAVCARLRESGAKI